MTEHSLGWLSALPPPGGASWVAWGTTVDEPRAQGWHAVGQAMAGSHHRLHVQHSQGLGDLGAGVHLAVHAHQEGSV